MENLNELKHLVNKELDKIIDKGDMTASELECAYKIVKMLSIINSMDDGYSGKLEMYYSRDHDDYSGARMRSPRTGRYISRDNVADMHYSGHNDMDLIKDLEMKLDYTQNERERQAIIDTINIIKNKG